MQAKEFGTWHFTTIAQSHPCNQPLRQRARASRICAVYLDNCCTCLIVGTNLAVNANAPGSRPCCISASTSSSWYTVFANSRMTTSKICTACSVHCEAAAYTWAKRDNRMLLHVVLTILPCLCLPVTSPPANSVFCETFSLHQDTIGDIAGQRSCIASPSSRGAHAVTSAYQSGIMPLTG